MAVLPSYGTVGNIGTYPTALSSPGVNTGTQMDPFTLYLLASAAVSAYGAYENSQSANANSQIQQSDTQQSRSDIAAQNMVNFLNGQQTLQNTQANQGLMSTQLDPYAQQKDLNKANVQRSFASGYTPGKGFTGSFDMSALDPNSLASAKTQFDKYVAASSPNVPISGDPSAEAFRNTYATNQSSQSQQIQDYLQSEGPYGPIYGLYNSVTGGQYKPSPAEVAQFGTNIDPAYLQKIQQQLYTWWASNPKNPNYKPPQQGVTPPNPGAGN